MVIAPLLKVPDTEDEWQRWSFNNAQDHLTIINQIQKTTGNILSITLLTGGSGYTSIPTLELDQYGTGAEFQVSIAGGVITSLTVTAGGSGYRSHKVIITGGGGSGATASLTVSPFFELPFYQMDPINFNNITEFFVRHAQAHADMNGVLKLQSTDLSPFDIRDKNKLQEWIYANYQEHNNVHEALQI